MNLTHTRPARFGTYDKRISLYTVSTTVNDDGSPKEVETKFADRWAAIIPAGQGREYMQAASINADISLALEMRYLAGVTPRHRVKFRGRIFEIAHAENVDEANRITRLYCKEKVS